MRKNRFVAIACVLVMLLGIMLTGCSENKTKEAGDIIGIIGAMEEEVASLKEDAKISKTTKIAEMDFCEGTLEGKKVVIVQCGRLS